MPAKLKRDMDLVRSLLLEIESGRTVFQVLSADTAAIIGADEVEALPADEAARLELHLGLLENAGFVEFRKLGGSIWHVQAITWNGYEFLETVRDGEVWSLVKEGAQRAGNASLALIWELGKAMAKKVAAERLGIVLD